MSEASSVLDKEARAILRKWSKCAYYFGLSEEVIYFRPSKKEVRAGRKQ